MAEAEASVVVEPREAGEHLPGREPPQAEAPQLQAPRHASSLWSRLLRIARHLGCTRARTRALFPRALLEQIERTCFEAEARHVGEIRFAIETALPFAALWHGITPRARAVQLFAHLHLWDSPHNNGVLIYVLRADRAIEIVADRGISAHVVPEEWQAICREVQTLYGQGRYAEGSRAAVAAVAALLIRHFPAGAPESAVSSGPGTGNELPIQPILL